MEYYSCVVCTTPAHRIAIQENGYSGRHCNRCQTIFIAPKPEKDEIYNLYGHDQAFVSSQDQQQADTLKQLHAKHMLSLIKKYVTSGRLLEIGAGSGVFLRMARENGYCVSGIELNRTQAVEIQSKGISCVTEPLNTHGEQYDIIYHCDVMSHLYNPLEDVRTMWYRLKPGGYLIFETGNIGDIPKWQYRLFSQFQYPDHLVFFSEKSIEKLLDLAGFSVIRRYRYTIVPQLLIMKGIARLRSVLKTNKNSAKNNYQNSDTVAQSRKVSQSKKNTILKKIYHYFMHHLRYTIGRWLPHGCNAQTIVIVAQKMRDNA